MATDWSPLLDPRIVCWVILPALTGLATLADPNPRRARAWFWGGAVVILASLILLADG